MRLLLIRHGETEHNVAGLLAGVTDSRLTNHGVIQTQRLGAHLIKKKQLKFTHIFASDLQRASRTAQAIVDAHNTAHEDATIEKICLPLIREQDFGSFELLTWNRSEEVRANDPKPEDEDFKPKETADAMRLRAKEFLQDYIFLLLAIDDDQECCIAVVSHGLFLGALWRELLLNFQTSAISLAPDVIPPSSTRPLEYSASWTNTGVLEILVKTVEDSNAQETKETNESGSTLAAMLRVVTINNKDHLINLKRTRGGLGSSASDDKQKSIDRFFKKPKTIEKKIEAKPGS